MSRKDTDVVKVLKMISYHQLMKKLLICDIDGTLTIKGGQLLPKTRRVLMDCHEKGILSGLATGRPVDGRTMRRFREWGLAFDPDLLIGVNGCETWDRFRDKKERHDLLPKEEVKAILDFMWPLDVNVVVFEDGYDKVLARRLDKMIEDSMNRNRSNVEFVTKERFCQQNVVKLEFHYSEEMEETIMKMIAEHPSAERTAIKSFKGTLEFMKPGVSKGSALIRMAKELDIDLQDVIACGDMDNDVEMLKAAGVGICLANGSDKAKAAADYVTEMDVEHDGLGDFFAKNAYLFNK